MCLAIPYLSQGTMNSLNCGIQRIPSRIWAFQFHQVTLNSVNQIIPKFPMGAGCFQPIVKGGKSTEGHWELKGSLNSMQNHFCLTKFPSFSQREQDLEPRVNTHKTIRSQLRECWANWAVNLFTFWINDVGFIRLKHTISCILSFFLPCLTS